MGYGHLYNPANQISKAAYFGCGGCLNTSLHSCFHYYANGTLQRITYHYTGVGTLVWKQDKKVRLLSE